MQHHKHHRTTPLHGPLSRPSGPLDQDDLGVICNICRPTKPSPIPNNIFRSIFASISKKSPRSMDPSAEKAEQWKLAASELSQRVLEAIRKRDEALMEVSRLKLAMAELEKKLTKLELYCLDLKSGMDVCNSGQYLQPTLPALVPAGFDRVVEPFLPSVSEARAAVRRLSRSLAVQLRQTCGGKVSDRVSALLRTYDLKMSASKYQNGVVILCLDALLNRVFYEDFESTGFQRHSSDPILNPTKRCEANFASFQALKGLSWDEVLNKGTRHFSQDFSRFCDRKMSEIVGMLGWKQGWPEALLQAFFRAAKGVWLVHLLAFAVHPGWPICRVEKGARFEQAYMEDMVVGKKGRMLVPTTVRVMVAPGFYVCSSVVKCKVLCGYDQQPGEME